MCHIPTPRQNRHLILPLGLTFGFCHASDLAETLLAGKNTPMKYGYARTSTDDQVAGLAAQVEALEKAGAKKVYREHVSGAATEREQLDRLMERLEECDTLMVTKMDR